MMDDDKIAGILKEGDDDGDGDDGDDDDGVDGGRDDSGGDRDGDHVGSGHWEHN